MGGAIAVTFPAGSVPRPSIAVGPMIARPSAHPSPFISSSNAPTSSRAMRSRLSTALSPSSEAVALAATSTYLAYERMLVSSQPSAAQLGAGERARSR